MNFDINCIFCKKFGLLGNIDGIKWYDQELFIYKNLVVVPALGPFSEGYVMIISRQHYPSVASFTNDLLVDMIELKKEVSRVIQKEFSDPIIFEHGAGPLSGGGSCINHAHFHICASKSDLLPTLKMKHNLISIDKFEFLSEYKHQPYIYYESLKGEMYVSKADKIPGQYFRRLLAAALGISDNWDYALFPNYDFIKETVKKLTPWPKLNGNQK